MRVTIRNQSEDKLTEQEWDFWAFVDGGRAVLQMRLSSYSVFHRQTKRHKYQIVEHYNRLDPRSNTSHFRGTKPIVPEDVKQRAIDEFLKIIQKTIEWEF
jgi:hypothetical protein